MCAHQYSQSRPNQGPIFFLTHLSKTKKDKNEGEKQIKQKKYGDGDEDEDEDEENGKVASMQVPQIFSDTRLC